MIVSRSNNFDLLRLLAAVQVAYGHIIYHLKLPAGPDWFFNISQSFPGVAVFFVVSGFLVTDSYLRSKTISGFGVKRALRIYPGLVGNLAIITLALMVTGGFRFDNFASNLLFMFSYVLTAQMSWAAMLFDNPHLTGWFFSAYPSGVLWTLGVELTFYLALPLVLEIAKRLRAVGAFYIVAISALSILIANMPASQLGLSVLPFFWVFAFGILARLYWNEVRFIFEGKGLWWLAAHVAIAAYLHFKGQSAFVFFVTPSIFEAVRTAVLAGAVLSLAFTWPMPSLLRGHDLSYGVYLYHMLVVYTLMGLGLSGSIWLWPVAMGGTFLLAAMSWFLIERPAMHIRAGAVPRKSELISA